MSDFQQFKNRLKFVKASDVLAVFPMVVGLLGSIPLKLVRRNIWLVCERRHEARDNGYWFYKYLVDKHPEIYAVYAIDKKAVDYKKVASLGKVIQFGTIIHWAYYFAAVRNISSQKEGKPNAALCYILEVYLGLRKNRAYIRHGIVYNDQRWVYYDVTKMNLFACSSEREYEFVKDRFGYPEGNVQLVGLCRYDNLMTPHEVHRQIIVMPTMREWLRSVSSDTLKYEGTEDISQSEYVKKWNEFLNNESLSEVLKQKDVDLIFFPHSSLQKYLGLFDSKSERIHIANASKYDVQQLLMESAALVTDYSSIFFDFAYMKKPLLYYQFDYEKFRKGNYQEGYFSYDDDGFGAVCKDGEELVRELSQIIDSDFRMDEKYCERVNSFFAFRDNMNCERTFNAISNMNNGGK